jgi:integrase
MKEFLEADEYVRLIKTSIGNHEVRDAFIFCCYTGLRWCDVKRPRWKQIRNNVLITTIIQKKTGKPVELTLHPIAGGILDNRRKKLTGLCSRLALTGRLIFSLPTADGANKHHW